jgi:very-short-patch-repair endonuclease
MNKKRIHTNKLLQGRRGELRKNVTSQEIRLWQYLKSKKLGYTFQRQHSIGIYIADFYCAQRKLIIELDGTQHKLNYEYDFERTLYLEGLGYRVLRFWNFEVDNDIDKVLFKIKNEMVFS